MSRRVSGLGIFVPFAFASMVLVLGVGAEALARHEARRIGAEQAIREAQLIGALVQPLFAQGVTNLSTSGSGERAELQQAAQQLSGSGSLEGLRLWGTDGVLLIDFAAPGSGAAPGLAESSSEPAPTSAPTSRTESMSDPRFGDAVSGRSTRAGTASAGTAIVVLQPLWAADGTVVGVAEIEVEPSHAVWDAARDRLRLVLMAAVAVVWSLLAGSAHLFTRAMRKNARELRHQANFDPLTGLPNLRNFTEQGNAVVARLGMNAEPATVVLFDLVGFTQINSTVGRVHGDGLLRGVAERVQAAAMVGSVGGQDPLVARVGGDVFAVLLPGVGATAALAQLEPFRAAIATEVEVEGIPISFETASGVAAFPVHGQDIGVLLQRADLAMEQAKTRRAEAAVYDPGTDRSDGRRLGLAVELRRAIANDELLLHYQPKVHLVHGTVTGVEALVRWQHPQRGLISPADFIPVAEATGLIVPLTVWVLDQALEQTMSWAASGLMLPVAVNVSAKSLRDDGFVEKLLRLLARKAVPTDLIEVEITETAIITDPERAARSVRRLRDAGVAVALDDFGQGATSLAYLEHFAMSTIKMDKSFVDGVCDGGAGASIVRSIIGLAHNLGMDVVAEGVEQASQKTVLAAWGCDVAQGYHFARPMSAERVTEYIATIAAPVPAVTPAATADGLLPAMRRDAAGLQARQDAHPA